jgi:hypothetical protein
MTITAVSAAEAQAMARADFVTALREFADWVEANPDARLPDSPLINVRAKGTTRAWRLRDLQAIAESWNTPLITLPDGTFMAELVWGPLTCEAHVAPANKGTTAWLEDARKRAAGNGVAA